MTKRDILSIAITVLGIRYLLYVIMMLPGITLPKNNYNNTEFNMGIYSLVSIVIYLIAVILLLANVGRITNLFIRNDKQIEVQPIKGNEVNIIAIALLLIGLYYSFTSIVTLLHQLPTYFAAPDFYKRKYLFSHNFIDSQIFRLLLSTAFGLILAFTSTKIANWFCGVDKNEEVEEDE